MPSAVTQHFMDRLRETERTRDVGHLVAFFTEAATLSRVGHAEPGRGADGARRFWQQYLDAFREVRSEFTAVTEADGRAVLEWTSHGALIDGRPVRYAGVSILEYDGERVRAFRTYYDSAALLTPAAVA